MPVVSAIQRSLFSLGSPVSVFRVGEAISARPTCPHSLLRLRARPPDRSPTDAPSHGAPRKRRKCKRNLAQADRITLSALCSFDDLIGDHLAHHEVPSGIVKLSTGGVICRAHRPSNLGVERTGFQITNDCHRRACGATGLGAIGLSDVAAEDSALAGDESACAFSLQKANLLIGRPSWRAGRALRGMTIVFRRRSSPIEISRVVCFEQTVPLTLRYGRPFVSR
jgi:hypothetical protein